MFGLEVMRQTVYQSIRLSSCSPRVFNRESPALLLQSISQVLLFQVIGRPRRTPSFLQLEESIFSLHGRASASDSGKEE